ncbi:hypothetical protein KM043_016103 [Ampulex compressa]|nr:hypothetical protein KM043_016103 [Ampulex compressa]
MADKDVFSLTRLDGKNFALWKYGVSFLFEAQDLMGCLDGIYSEPNKTTALVDWQKWKKSQAKTAVILLSSMDQSLHANLVNCATPEEMWRKLHALYGDTSEDSKQRCWHQFYEFRVKDGEPIATQIERFETLCKRLCDAKEKLSDAAIMSKLLSSFPSRFSTFTMAWECTAQNERIKENLITRIIRKDKRQTQAEEKVSTLALQVKSLHVRPNGSHSKMDSNGERNYKKKSNSKKLEELKKKTLCAYCHEKGHWYRV